MMIWFCIIAFSIFIGLMSALIFSGRKGLIASGALPWFSLLGWLLYSEYFLPYRGGGASMWPIAQIFAGTVAAVTGVGTYLLYKQVISRKN